MLSLAGVLLNVPRRFKRRIHKREPVQLAAGSFVNRGWALDFKHDVLYDGRRFRTLNVIDELNSEALAIQACEIRAASAWSPALVAECFAKHRYVRTPSSIRKMIHSPVSFPSAILVIIAAIGGRLSSLYLRC